MLLNFQFLITYLTDFWRIQLSLALKLGQIYHSPEFHFILSYNALEKRFTKTITLLAFRLPTVSNPCLGSTICCMESLGERDVRWEEV